MNKYKTIEKIMKSEKADENMKMYYIEMFVKGWCTEKDMGWLWEDLQKTHFANDEEKMVDFKILSKEEFLSSYSYLTEEEYDLTVEYLKNNNK